MPTIPKVIELTLTSGVQSTSQTGVLTVHADLDRSIALFSQVVHKATSHTDVIQGDVPKTLPNVLSSTGLCQLVQTT